jgi:hypothetical protein
MKKLLLISVILLAMTGITNAQVTVVLNVDMHGSGLAAGEAVYFAGNFGGIYGTWNEPGTNTNNQLLDPNNDSVYTVSINVAAASYQFKFFKGAGWNGGEWTGDPNRVINVVHDTITHYQWGSLFPVGINNSPLAGKVSVYPMPFGNTLNVTSSIDIASMVMVSANGGTVISLENQDSKALIVNTSELAAGMYFVTFRTKAGMPYSMKVVKK